MRRMVVGAVMVLSLFAMAGHASNGVGPSSRRWAIVNFADPVMLHRNLLMGMYLIVHDDERMARGEPCTSVYRFDPERGPQAVDPSREYVDGAGTREPVTESQRQAVRRLNRIERELGTDGAALVHDVLVLGLTMEQIGQRRAVHSQRWRDYFAKRFQECLDRLALFYGFAAPARIPVKSLPR